MHTRANAVKKNFKKEILFVCLFILDALVFPHLPALLGLTSSPRVTFIEMTSLIDNLSLLWIRAEINGTAC